MSIDQIEASQCLVCPPANDVDFGLQVHLPAARKVDFYLRSIAGGTSDTRNVKIKMMRVQKGSYATSLETQ